MKVLKLVHRIGENQGKNFRVSEVEWHTSLTTFGLALRLSSSHVISTRSSTKNKAVQPFCHVEWVKSGRIYDTRKNSFDSKKRGPSKRGSHVTCRSKHKLICLSWNRTVLCTYRRPRLYSSVREKPYNAANKYFSNQNLYSQFLISLREVEELVKTWLQVRQGIPMGQHYRECPLTY